MNVRRKLIAVALGAGLALTGLTFGMGGNSAAKPAPHAQMEPTTTTTRY
jgi:hypothetical protein